jgi:hypothetical protein
LTFKEGDVEVDAKLERRKASLNTGRQRTRTEFTSSNRPFPFPAGLDRCQENDLFLVATTSSGFDEALQ